MASISSSSWDSSQHTCVEATVRHGAELGYEVPVEGTPPRASRMSTCTRLSISTSPTTPVRLSAPRRSQVRSQRFKDAIALPLASSTRTGHDYRRACTVGFGESAPLGKRDPQWLALAANDRAIRVRLIELVEQTPTA